RGRLAIGTSTTIGVYLLPDVFVKFRQKYPGIDATLDVASSAAIAQRVADGSLDVGLIESPPADGMCDAEQFMSDQLVAVAGRGHALLKKSRVSAEMFCREPFVVRSTGSDTKSFIERELAARGLAPRPVMALPSTEAIKRAVAAGIGVGVISQLSIGMELKLKTLAVVRVTGLALRRPFYRIIRRGTRPGNAMRTFLELLQSSLN
ncbi:MAG TPA: LysR substrate-binding domain-containing protein, partial [Tepidisphaeraceae bacterium]|nr:LysR substrate-binding domain-containing protein [Tepidisphaeraceae bacterium]